MKASRSISGTILPSLALCAVASLPLQARAQGWIVGGAAGSAEQDRYEVAGPVTTRDDSDSAFRVFGGYQISPMQAVIASYVDLGRPFYDGPAFGGFADFMDADGIDVSYVVGWAPGNQGRVSLFGTVGVIGWDQNVTLTDVTGIFEFHDEGTSFSAGLGAEVNVRADGTSPWGIHVDYQLFKDVGDADNSGVELDREMISVGVAYRFGGPN